MINAVVLHYRAYDFPNERGEQIKGVKITYLDLEDYQDAPAVNGFVPATVDADYSILETIGKFPAHCGLEFKTKTLKAGAKPTLFLKSIERIADLDFYSILGVRS